MIGFGFFRTTLCLCLQLCVYSITFAQTIDAPLAQEDFKPSGKIYGDLFVNANLNVTDQYASFRLNRLHLAYKYQFTPNWYFNGMLESALEDYAPIAQGGDYNNITNLFEFCAGYSSTKWEAKFGLIATELNLQQERMWKHRYVDKVYADKYALAPTNDFGFLIKYKTTQKLSFDLAVTNGEGHKNLQADSSFRYAIGSTVKLNRFVTARAYADMVAHGKIIQSNLIFMLGLHYQHFNLGMEWNQQQNSQWNKGFHKSGYSSYLNVNINPKLQFFGRFDYVSSNRPEDFTYRWNELNDGILAISGVQYQVIQNIQLALNYRSWQAAEQSSASGSYVFLDLALVF